MGIKICSSDWFMTRFRTYGWQNLIHCQANAWFHAVVLSLGKSGWFLTLQQIEVMTAQECCIKVFLHVG